MSLPVCRVLIADTQRALTELKIILAGLNIELFHADSYQAAIELVRAAQPHLCAVGYHFDEARPYRLISELRSQFGDVLPILLIRVLPKGESEQEALEIRDSYRALGATDYLPLYEHAAAAGWENARANF